MSRYLKSGLALMISTLVFMQSCDYVTVKAREYALSRDLRAIRDFEEELAVNKLQDVINTKGDRMMDFATFHRNRHQKNIKRRCTAGPDEAPEYYEHIAKKICLIGEHQRLRLHRGKLKQEVLTPIQPEKWWVNQIETRLNEPSIDIWTDGSLYANTGDMGAAAIFNKQIYM